MRDIGRQKEREGELDLDTTTVVREKEEQLMKYEKVVETYKTKIEVCTFKGSYTDLSKIPDCLFSFTSNLPISLT